MQSRRLFWFLALFSTSLFLWLGCSDTDDRSNAKTHANTDAGSDSTLAEPDARSDTDPSSDSGGGTSATNVAQKGPFETGANVEAFALDASGQRTGDSTSTTTGPRGDWSLSPASWSAAPTEVVVQGTFFDEETGEFGEEQRRLRSIVWFDSESLETNVNLYTHFHAARLETLLGEGVAFEQAHERASTDLSDWLDIDAPPSTLDLLDAEGDRSTDNGNLLSFSVALLASDIDQAGIDAIAADFGDDGRLDGDGRIPFESIRETTADQIESLFETARAHLERQYGETPPQLRGPGGFAWIGGGCAAARLFRPQLLCVDDSTDVVVPEDQRVDLEVLIDDPGSHALLADFDDFSRNRSWTVYGDKKSDGSYGSEMGKASSEGGYIEDFITLPLARERTYWIELFNGGDRTTFSVSLDRVSDGTQSDPQRLRAGRAFDGVAGTFNGGGRNNSSYYVLEGVGDHVVTVGDYTCGGAPSTNLGGQGVDLYLYRGEPEKPYEAFEQSTAVEIARADGACSVNIVHPLEAKYTYYLRVQNKNFLETFRPAPVGETYTIRLERN